MERFARAFHGRWLGGLLLGSAVVNCFVGEARSEEIAPFRINATDGHADVRYARDDYTTESGGDAGAHQQQSDFRTEVFLNGHGYIYHPNLLTLDVGGGPVFDRQRYLTDSGETASSSTQYNLSLRGVVLKDKPLRGSFFFDHLNPTQSVAPGQVITQENQRYGADVSLLSPVTPVPLNAAFSHTESKGRGADRVVNDDTDQFSFRASKAYGALGSTQFQYQSMKQTSVSGSASVPIQASRNGAEGVTVDSRLQWGGKEPTDLTQLFSMNRRTYEAGALRVPNQDDMRLMLDLRYRPDADLQEFVSADTYQNRQGEIHSDMQSFGGGINYRPFQGMELTSSARAENNSSESFKTQLLNVNGSANYTTNFEGGILNAGYSLSVDQRDQQATSATAPVIGETAVLTGTQFVTLAHAYVVAGSVVVSNVNRTQVYIENVDYQVTVVGNQTRIQRLVAGLILDGESVQIDYRYDTGGTYSYRQTDQTAMLGWTYGRYFNASVRVQDSEPTLTSGNPTIPFNTVHDVLWAVRMELPMTNWGWFVGGNFEQEKRDETIAPFVRTSTEAYLQNDDPLPGFGSLRVGTRRNKVIYSNGLQNVNLTAYDLRYGARPAFGWDLSFSSTYERDQGGLLPRTRLDGAFNAQWRERKLTMTISFVRTRETQGPMQRNRSLLQWLLRRDF
ncbi:MAG TPA: hypothetical protein VFW68_08210 [Rhodocyclaceae bacterium]|nr:hypothetical protein [Rhodocyclaceae bacterium]